MDADADVQTQTFLSNGALGHFDKLLRCHSDIVALAIDLVWFIPQHLVEFLPGDLNQAGMRHPGAIMAIGRFTVLILTHFF